MTNPNAITRRRLLGLLFAAPLLAPQIAPSAAAADAPHAGLVVMLKLDDLGRQGLARLSGLEGRWQCVTDFLKHEKIKAA